MPQLAAPMDGGLAAPTGGGLAAPTGVQDVAQGGVEGGAAPPVIVLYVEVDCCRRGENTTRSVVFAGVRFAGGKARVVVLEEDEVNGVGFSQAVIGRLGTIIHALRLTAEFAAAQFVVVFNNTIGGTADLLAANAWPGLPDYASIYYETPQRVGHHLTHTTFERAKRALSRLVGDERFVCDASPDAGPTLISAADCTRLWTALAANNRDDVFFQSVAIAAGIAADI